MKTQLLIVCLSASLFCAACGTIPPPAQIATALPTPTIASAPIAPTTAAVASATPQLVIEPVVPAATATPPPDQSATTGTPAAPFAYLWPAYLPDGMRISANESRVARESEIGTTGTGFYLVTLNGSGRKLVIGGGATDTLPLLGDSREVTYDGKPATLTTHDSTMQLVFIHNGAKFFVYSSGLSEQELMLVAESMVPIDVASLRDQITPPQS